MNIEEQIKQIEAYLKSLGYVLHCESENWEDHFKITNQVEISFLPKGFEQEKMYDPRILPKTKDGKYHGFAFRMYSQAPNLERTYFQAYMASDDSMYTFIPGGYMYKGTLRKENYIPTIEFEEVKNFVQQLIDLL